MSNKKIENISFEIVVGDDRQYVRIGDLEFAKVSIDTGPMVIGNPSEVPYGRGLLLRMEGNLQGFGRAAWMMGPEFPTKPRQLPEIEHVIYNDPATIVFWEDGTKTVVKAQPPEPYEREKGLAMAIAKKSLGNTGSYYDVLKKFLR